MIRIRSRHSRRTLPTQRSACAFARGAAIGARITLIPSELKTSSKVAVNLLSRSRIKKVRPLLLLGESHGQVARLLGDPGAVRVGGDADEVHAAARQFDEEEHVEPMQPKRLDREEVTLEDPGSLLAEEFSPAHARLSRRRLDPVAMEQIPDGTRRQADAEPDQLAVDPLVPPARVLRRQAQDELPRPGRHRRPAGGRPGYVQRRRMSSRCHRNNVAGWTRNNRRRARGST
jgi:hypothetical protein